MAKLNRRPSRVGGAGGIAGWGGGPAVGTIFSMVLGPLDIPANQAAAEHMAFTAPFDMTIIEVQGYNRIRGAAAKNSTFNVKDDGTTILSAATNFGTDGAVAVATLSTSLGSTDGVDVAEDSDVTIELANVDLTTITEEAVVTIFAYSRRIPSTLETGLAPFDS